jgi:hypothetical protein
MRDFTDIHLLEHQLRNFAMSKVDVIDASLRPSRAHKRQAEDYFNYLIGAGIRKLQAEFGESVPSDTAMTAMKNLDLYASEATRYAQVKKELSIDILTKIAEKLCPLYPFC